LLPFDVDRVRIIVSKHFRNTWMKRWDWDHLDLREAIREAHNVSRVGRAKWDIFIRKKGPKKLVLVYDAARGEVFVITGAKG